MKFYCYLGPTYVLLSPLLSIVLIWTKFLYLMIHIYHYPSCLDTLQKTEIFLCVNWKCWLPLHAPMFVTLHLIQVSLEDGCDSRNEMLHYKHESIIYTYYTGRLEQKIFICFFCCCHLSCTWYPLKLKWSNVRKMSIWGFLPTRFWNQSIANQSYQFAQQNTIGSFW